MREIKFFVPGVPVAKARPRATTIGGSARLYTPSKTRDYEALVATVAKAAMAGRPPTGVAVSVFADVLLPVPASWSKRKREDALAGRVFAKVRPDSDNYLKAIKDGMNGVVYLDDGQSVRSTAQKRYAAVPGVHVLVCHLEED